MKDQKIKPIALCVFRYKDNILVTEGFDEQLNQLVFKPLGGEMSFGEYSWETIRREIRNEIGEDIANLSFIGPSENIFSLNGNQAHELIFVFEAEFVNKSVYKSAEIHIGKNGNTRKAVWKPLKEFKKKTSFLYPDGLLEILNN